MSFLAPFFLAGIALIAGPILFHLIRQAQRKRIVFSSTEFLEKSEPKRERSRRIQNPWLLLIRCLIIAVLAFAFARPFIPSSSQETPIEAISRNVVIAIDNSASLDRPGFREQLLFEANELIKGLLPTDTLSVFTFHDEIHRIIDSEQWSALPTDQRQSVASRLLSEISPSARSSQLDKAIIVAGSETEQHGEKNENATLAEIFVLSDFASGTNIEGLLGFEWPERVSVNRIQIGPALPETNIGLRWLGWTREAEPGSQVARLSLISSSPEKSVALTLQAFNADTGAAIGLPLQLTTGGQSETVITIPFDARKVDTPIRFELNGDAYSFDNTLHVAPPYVPEFQVTILSDSDSSDTKEAPYFIHKAFQGFESPLVVVNAGTSNLDQASGYIIDRPLDSAEADRIRSEISKGKPALLCVSETEYVSTIRNLTQQPEWQVESYKGDYRLFGSIDFEHALFKPFSDSRFSNFASIRTWESARLDVPENDSTKILARFDDGSPLLCETKIGDGTLYLWASSWRPSSSQWILSTKFIPFLHRFALQCTGGPALSGNAIWNAENKEAYQKLPDIQKLSSTGLYTTSTGTAGRRWIAMQLSPEESLTTPIGEDRWDQLQLPELSPASRLSLLERLAETSKKESNVETEQRQHIWQWMLWAALALLGLESIVAIRATKSREAVA